MVSLRAKENLPLPKSRAMQLYSFLDDGELYGASLAAAAPPRSPAVTRPPSSGAQAAQAAQAAAPKQPSSFDIILGNLAIIERRLASVEERVATAVERLAAAEELRAAAAPSPWLSWPAVLAALVLAYCLYRWCTHARSPAHAPAHAPAPAYSVLTGPHPPTPVFLATAPNSFLPPL